MVTLGGIQLDSNILWQDQYTWSPVVQEVDVTLGGNPVTFSRSVNASRPITLEATRTQGWLTKAQVDSLRALADVAGATYTLVIEAQNFIVQFRHEEAPALDFRPLIPRLNIDDQDYMVGVIKLMEV